MRTHSGAFMSTVVRATCLELVILLIFYDFNNVVVYQIWFIHVGCIEFEKP